MPRRALRRLTFRQAADPVERPQRRDPLDRRRDRPELAVDGERGDDDEGDQPGVGPERGEQRDAGDGAGEVGAGVAEHRPLAQRQRRADEQRRR